MDQVNFVIFLLQSDDLRGKVRAHRSKEGMSNASFLYLLVPGKSIAWQLETLLINQLPSKGFQLTNLADSKHRNFGTSDVSMENFTLHRCTVQVPSYSRLFALMCIVTSVFFCVQYLVSELSIGLAVSLW